jgi:hypothetical protein
MRESTGTEYSTLNESFLSSSLQVYAAYQSSFCLHTLVLHHFYLAYKLGLKGVISSPGREICHVGCGVMIEDATWETPNLHVQ